MIVGNRKDNKKNEYLEIERKYLVKSLPRNITSRNVPRYLIRQGYLACSEKGTEIRIRKKINKCNLTVKKGRGRLRIEVELALAKKQFEKLWPLTNKLRVTKLRYELPYRTHIIEVDVYRGPLSGLLTAEVEFKSVKSSSLFKSPEWFGKEITRDARYKNCSLALKGIPQD